MTPRTIQKLGRSTRLWCLLALAWASAGCAGNEATTTTGPASGGYGEPGGSPGYSSPKMAFYGEARPFNPPPPLTGGKPLYDGPVVIDSSHAKPPDPPAVPSNPKPIPDEERTDARRVVFLVGRSGSMIGVFGDLKIALKQAINAMPPPGPDGCVLFDIITFSDEKVPLDFSRQRSGKKQLLIDSAANKTDACEFIDEQVASGGSLPLPAIKASLDFAHRPDVLWVLADQFDRAADFDKIVKTLKDANADGKTTINCVQFVGEPDPQLVKLFQSIAENGHGSFTQIPKTEISKRLTALFQEHP